MVAACEYSATDLTALKLRRKIVEAGDSSETHARLEIAKAAAKKSVKNQIEANEVAPIAHRLRTSLVQSRPALSLIGSASV